MPWVTSPAGSITHTIRGAFKRLTRSASEVAPTAPLALACLTASRAASNTTTSCSESRRMRCAIPPPILPIPTNPIWLKVPPLV